MQGKKDHQIIILDNHPVVIEGLISLINETPNFHIVGVASDGKDLRKLLKTAKANTIFLDLKLPQTYIYGLVKNLIVEHTHIKIIVFTNYLMPKLVQNIMSFGVHAYLSKAAPFSEILETVEKVHNGEYFISPSVYINESKSKIEDNHFVLSHEDQQFKKFATLTERELDVVILLSRGMTNKEIADKLCLSNHTIETHRKNIMEKCKMKTKEDLIYFASQYGLV